MATDKPRLSISMDEETLKKVLEYKEEKGIATQSKAIIKIMEMGLEDLEKNFKNKNATHYSCEAIKLAEDFEHHMDDRGRETVRGVADLEVARYKSTLQEQRGKMEAAQEPQHSVIQLRFSVPGYSMPMSAGTGQEAGQEYPENYTLVKEPPRGTSFIASVSGNSMEPTYHDGDLLFIHACEEVAEGQIGVFFMDGQQWVKELGDGELISHNPDYAHRPMTEDIKCQGLVLGVCDKSYFA